MCIDEAAAMGCALPIRGRAPQTGICSLCHTSRGKQIVAPDVPRVYEREEISSVIFCCNRGSDSGRIQYPLCICKIGSDVVFSGRANVNGVL